MGRKIRQLSHYTNYDAENYDVVEELIEAYEVENIGVIVYTTITKWAYRPETQNTFLPGKTLVKDRDEIWHIV